MNNFLATALKFQSVFGVDLSFDFTTGRDFLQTEISKNVINITPQTEQPQINENTSNQNTIGDTNIKQTIKSVNLDGIKSFEELCEAIKNFNDCDLKRSATNTVIFDGNTKAKIMLIGEAPGESEDLEGKPFCGQSGKLLRKALSFIGLNEQTMFITNTVFWRPPLNRKPTTDEIELCRPFVNKMIEIIHPELIILCGSTAMETILQTTEKMSKITGTIREVQINNNSVKAFTIYHPSYLLRVPSQKKVFWEHLICLSKKLNCINAM